MSTFLALAQKLQQEAEIPGAAIAAVTGQTGQLKRLVDWVSDAWKDIQLKNPNWRWMRTGFTLNTVAGDSTYAYTDCTDVKTGAAIARFQHWWAHDRLHPFQCYLSSSGVASEFRLRYVPWDSFRWQYRFGTQNNNVPIHVSVDDEDNLVIGPKPNAVYVVSGDFQRGVQVLAADGDTPDMPSNFHDVIVYWALEKYGANSVAAETFARAVREGRRLMRALERNQLPEVLLAEPLT